MFFEFFSKTQNDLKFRPRKVFPKLCKNQKYFQYSFPNSIFSLLKTAIVIRFEEYLETNGSVFFFFFYINKVLREFLK